MSVTGAAQRNHRTGSEGASPPSHRPRTFLVRAEWTKVTSTRLLVTAVGLAVGLSLLVTTLLGMAMGSRENYCATAGNTCVNGELRPPATVVTAGVLGDGIPGAGLSVLMVLGAMILLVEHRYGTISTAFMATPQRWKVLVTKAGVVAVTAFVVTLLTMVASGIAFSAVGGPAAGNVDPWSASMLGIHLRTALVVALAAVFGLAVAALTWNITATLALVLLWPVLIETLLPTLVPGDAGERLAGYLPFANARRFVGMVDPVEFPWPAAVSGLWFAAVVAVLFALALWRTRRVVVR